jgi:hypothetical protein
LRREQRCASTSARHSRPDRTAEPQRFLRLRCSGTSLH